MAVVAESFGLVVLLLGLLASCGWWLAHLLLPVRWRRFEYMLAPFAGLFWIDTVSHTASWMGLTGSEILPLLLVPATGLGAFAWFRRGPPRMPNRTELTVIACALPALLLALTPVIIAGQLLPIGDSNGDPIPFALMTEHLVSGSLRSQIPLAEGFKIWEPVFGMRTGGERLGFHFVQAALDILSGQPAHATFPVVSAVGLFLAAQAVFLLAHDGLGCSRPVAYGGVLLTAVNAYLLWFHYGGFGPQVLGSGLFAISLAFWLTTLREPSLRFSIWAAMAAAGLVGIYSEMVVHLFAIVGLAASVRGIALAMRRDVRRLKHLAMFLSVTALLVFLLNPVASVRAMRRYTDLLDSNPWMGMGNVDWVVDMRCVLGLMPFGNYEGRAVAGLPYLGPVLAAVAILLAALMLIGLTQVQREGRLGAFLVVLAHCALQTYFAVAGHTYGYFKGWGYGLPVYLILLSAGGHGLYNLLAGKPRTLAAVRHGAVLFLILAGAVSAYLSLEMEDHLACTPGVAELANGMQSVPPGASVYAVTGDPHRVRVFWIAYFLRERRAHFDAPVIYTSETARDYVDEEYVLVQRGSRFDPGQHNLASAPVWSGSEFDLYRVE